MILILLFFLILRYKPFLCKASPCVVYLYIPIHKGKDSILILMDPTNMHAHIHTDKHYTHTTHIWGLLTYSHMLSRRSTFNKL